MRWRNVDLENNTFDVTEQLSFKVPPKTKVIEEMAPPKSNGRKLPITELARPFFLKQLAMQEVQKEQAAKDGKPYYDNDLVVAKPDGAPIAASWVSSQFGKLLEDLDMPHIRFHDLRHSCASLLLANGVPMKMIQEWLGHSDFSTTANIYSHLDYASKVSSAEAMLNGLGMGSNPENDT